MPITNELFLKDRQEIELLMRYNDPKGSFVSTIPLTKDIFVKTETSTYQILGVNSSVEDGEYIEIFISVDVDTTMKHFDGKAVRTFYFNGETINDVLEISEVDVKKQYKRPEWRRLQKYIKKEKMNLVKKQLNHS